MKGNITLCLDFEVIIELKKEKNKSALINSYLRNYFSLNKKPEVEEPLKEEEKEDFKDSFGSKPIPN